MNVLNRSYLPESVVVDAKVYDRTKLDAGKISKVDRTTRDLVIVNVNSPSSRGRWVFEHTQTK